MQAAVFEMPHRINVLDVPVDRLRHDEIRIKVGACGVCGTDFHIFEGKAPAKQSTILGHEFTGEIVEIGKDVKELKVGDRIAVDPNIFCGYCEFCRIGKINLCENLKALGVTINGGFAEYCIVPLTQAYLLPSGFPYNIAAFAEPVSCCIHGINQADIKIGENVVIVGSGTIGLIMLQLAKLTGAGNVIALDISTQKRDRAASLGADYVFDPQQSDTAHKILEITKGGPTKVIECVGNSTAVEYSFSIVKKGGTIVIFGLAEFKASTNILLHSFFQKELTIVSSKLNPFTFDTAVNLLVSGKINVEKFNAFELNLNQDTINKLFNNPRDGSITKYLLKPVENN